MSVATVEKHKWLCEECGKIAMEDDVLKAPNPFDPQYELYGCPTCREVSTLVMACDEPGCRREVCCGIPTPNGYRQTCSEHKPEKE